MTDFMQQFNDTANLRIALRTLATDLNWYAAKIPLTNSDLDIVDNAVEEANYEIHQLIERVKNV